LRATFFGCSHEKRSIFLEFEAAKFKAYLQSSNLTNNDKTGRIVFKTCMIMSSGRIGATKLPEVTEVCLLRYLSEHNPKQIKFAAYANGKEAVFGSRSKKASDEQQKLGRAVSNRLNHLLTNRPVLIAALHKRGLRIPQYLEHEGTQRGEYQECPCGGPL
jgi:hypothetical protein